ncbi:ankyrin repeat domain-containing protein [uncultured Endozoicomonas sp.]|uniref:ankyrin repeat domain-containing protein n=1 Tax=uncultured Endozoicomonas sp. TaxID=432652 RepID=UPI0026067BF1|nr:ankyrin repeat domain-containing protein [uncultured Endozoicomonas sp.]
MDKPEKEKEVQVADILQACRSGDISTIEKAIAQGSTDIFHQHMNPEKNHSFKTTHPVGIAVENNSTKIVDLLIEQHVDLTISHKGYALVALACSKGNMGIVKAIIEAGAPITAGPNNISPYYAALMHGHQGILDYLYTKTDLKLQKIPVELRNLFLENACLKNEYPKLFALITDDTVNFNNPIPSELIPLIDEAHQHITNAQYEQTKFIASIINRTVKEGLEESKVEDTLNAFYNVATTLPFSRRINTYDHNEGESKTDSDSKPKITIRSEDAELLAINLPKISPGSEEHSKLVMSIIDSLAIPKKEISLLQNKQFQTIMEEQGYQLQKGLIEFEISAFNLVCCYMSVPELTEEVPLDLVVYQNSAAYKKSSIVLNASRKPTNFFKTNQELTKLKKQQLTLDSRHNTMNKLCKLAEEKLSTTESSNAQEMGHTVQRGEIKKGKQYVMYYSMV